MRYKVVLQKSAEKFIRKQDKKTQTKIITALNKLPYQGDIKRLKGENVKYRVRIGSIRAIYRLDNKQLIVDVLDIDSRGDIYK